MHSGGQQQLNEELPSLLQQFEGVVLSCELAGTSSHGGAAGPSDAPVRHHDPHVNTSKCSMSVAKHVAKRMCAAYLRQLTPPVSVTHISSLLHIDRHTVSRWCEKSTNHASNFFDAARTGRPSVLTPQSRDWVLATIQEVGQSASSVSRVLPQEQPGVVASRSTVSRCARAERLIWKMPRTVPLLTAAQRTKRVAFCEYWAQKDPHAIKSIMFSDEKNFRMFGPTVGAWKQVGVPYPHPVSAHSPRVLVWGAVGWYGKTPLYMGVNVNVNAASYIGEILEGIWLPFGERVECEHGISLMLAEDGARPHTANVTRAWHEAHHTYKVVGQPGSACHDRWPPNSPDINGPIENIWGDMAVEVGRQQLSTVDGLMAAIQEAWDNITQDRIDCAVIQWQQRLRRIVALNGFVYYPWPAGQAPDPPYPLISRRQRLDMFNTDSD
jgi:transposase